MDDPKQTKDAAKPAPTTPEQQARTDREAAALRQNLLRRKHQARARAAVQPEKPKT